jgi:hypothetical protein
MTLNLVVVLKLSSPQRTGNASAKCWLTGPGRDCCLNLLLVGRVPQRMLLTV